MPAVSAIGTEVIESLAGQLKFAGKATLVRHLERIEELAPAIEVDGMYPEDFIVFRVTGYRPEEGGDAMILGKALLGDLSALAERLSEAAGLKVSDLGVEGEDFETIDSLAGRWKVSRKTIERYRRLGLVARRVDLGSGHRGIVLMSGAVSWFEERFADRIGEAAEFSRMNQAMVDKIACDARRYRDRLGWGATQVSRRIGQRIGRSSESVRRVLIRHDEKAGEKQLFGVTARAGNDEQVLMLKEWLKGKRSGTIGARFGYSSVLVNRSVNRARRGLILEAGFGGKDRVNLSDESVLGEEVVCRGLVTRGATDLAGLFEQLRDQHAAVVYEQTARARAAGVLSGRCDLLARELHRSTPSGRVLDEIETAMRWMVLLRIELVATQLSLMLSTIEERIGGPIDSLSPARAVEIVRDGILVVYGVVERFEGDQNRRLAAPVGLAMARWCSRLGDVAVPAVEGKAGRRVVSGYEVEDWTRWIWGRAWGGRGWWLMPEVVLDGIPGELEGRDREILVRRYGVGGDRPWGLGEIGEWLETPAMHAGRIVLGALRRAEEKKAVGNGE